MKIVVVCQKNDFYLAKLCIASIRYFDDTVPIYLVKDFSNGKFSTDIVDKYFNVITLNLDIKFFGWGVAKIYALISGKFDVGEKLLILDADVIFAGNVLKTLSDDNSDFIVSVEYSNDPNSKWFVETYFDISAMSNYSFPGYSFNTGHFVATVGKLCEEDFEPYLSFKRKPYWDQKYKSLFPTADQSLFNLIVHQKEAAADITVGKKEFMVWPLSERAKEVNLKGLLNNKYDFVLHWAGCKRTSALEYMSHSDMLFFFKKEYYKRLPYGILLFKIDNYYQTIKYKTIFFIGTIKKHLIKKSNKKV